MDGARWGKQPLRGLDADRIPMVGPAYHGHSDFTRTLLHPCLIINSPRPFPAVAPLGPWPKWAHWSKGFWAPGPLGPWAPYPILSWANSPVAHGPKSPWTLGLAWLRVGRRIIMNPGHDYLFEKLEIMG